MNLKEVRDTLVKVREELQDIARSEGYSHHDDLGGWCVLSSYVIFHILKRKGYHPYLCRSNCHAFIECEGYYIDVTITQFNYNVKEAKYPAVYFEPTPDKKYHQVVQKTDKAKDIWSRTCKNWSQPLKLQHPRIARMIKTF